MIDLSTLPKKVTLKNDSFFEVMSMAQQCAYYGYVVADWDKRYSTFFGFITAIHYTIVMELPRLAPQDPIDKYFTPTSPLVSIEQRINAAVERDDFEEAARLRDLMNKK